MKKFFVIFILLIAVSFSAFAQDSALEGVWTGYDAGDTINFIFRGNLLIMSASTGEIILGTFTLERTVIKFHIESVFTNDGWTSTGGTPVTMDIAYRLSGGNLTLTLDGDNVTVRKAY